MLENITINRSWKQKTDRDIIQDAFGSVLPEISTSSSTVAQLSPIPLDFDAKDISLIQLLTDLSTLTGGEFRITEDKELSWRAAGSVVATFGFSDSPNHT